MRLFSIYSLASPARPNPSELRLYRKVAEGIAISDDLIILRSLEGSPKLYSFRSIAKMEETIFPDGRSRILWGNVAHSPTLNPADRFLKGQH